MKTPRPNQRIHLLKPKSNNPFPTQVLKIISAKSVFGQHVKPVVAEEIQVFPYHVPVVNLKMVPGYDKLIVLSEQEVKAVPLHRCSAVQVQTCQACVALKDPHCAWNVVSNSCVDKSVFGNSDR